MYMNDTATFSELLFPWIFFSVRAVSINRNARMLSYKQQRCV